MTTVPAPSGVDERGSVSLGNVVVVEDPLVSNLVRAVLQRHGYTVRLADALDAASLLQAADTVIVTNTPAPFLEFAGHVPLVYLTSQPDILLQAAFRRSRVVVKPFIPENLVQAVGALLHPSEP